MQKPSLWNQESFPTWECWLPYLVRPVLGYVMEWAWQVKILLSFLLFLNSLFLICHLLGCYKALTILQHTEKIDSDSFCPAFQNFGRKMSPRSYLLLFLPASQKHHFECNIFIETFKLLHDRIFLV